MKILKHRAAFSSSGVGEPCLVEESEFRWALLGESDVKVVFCGDPFEQSKAMWAKRRVLVFSVRDAKACGTESSIMRVM